jgi:hypothetical protein
MGDVDIRLDYRKWIRREYNDFLRDYRWGFKFFNWYVSSRAKRVGDWDQRRERSQLQEGLEYMVEGSMWEPADILEFREMPPSLLRKSLDTLVKRGKAQIIKGEGEAGEGVRFL